MTTTEPLSPERLYELCAQAKMGGSGVVKISAQELWALVDMAKEWDGILEKPKKLSELYADAVKRLDVAMPEAELTTCQAGSDGDCFHKSCPQLRDGEPAKTDRGCPLRVTHDEF